MTREVDLVLLEFGQAHEQAAIELLIPTLHRIFPGVRVRTTIVDNARPARRGPLVANEMTRVSGDNTLHEFSGWDQGLAWLEQCYAPPPASIVVLANDTVVRSDKRDRVRDTPQGRVLEAFQGALVGWLDEYPCAVELFGLILRQWVDTSFMIAQWRTWQTLRPLAHPLANTPLFDDDWRRTFRNPSPLSDNYRAYLKAYFFGEPVDDEFQHRWYACEPVSPLNFEAFKVKISCIFCEHLLSARARARDIPLVDTRPQALTPDGFAGHV